MLSHQPGPPSGPVHTESIMTRERGRNLILGAAIGIALAMLGLTISPSNGEETAPPVDPATLSGQALVDWRIGEMKRIGGMMGAIKRWDGNAASLGDLATAAEALRAAAGTIPAMFPENSGIGAEGVTKSRALPVIWEKWEDFVQDTNDLENAAAASAAAIATGDAEAIKASVQGIITACQGCHETFRGPEIQ